MASFHKKILVLLGIFGGIVFVFHYGGFSHYFSLETIQANAAYLQQAVATNYNYSVLLFIAISTALVVLTLPITGPMGIVGGFLFGVVWGTLYAMISVLMGAALSFLVIRYCLSKSFEHKYGERIQKFSAQMKVYGYSYLITLQLLTIVPFFIINTLAALAGVSLFTFLWTTLVGAVPVIFVYAFAGRQLHNITSWSDILSCDILLVLLSLAAIALLPMIIKRFQHRRAQSEN